MKLKFYSLDGDFKEERDYPIVEFTDDRGKQTLKETLVSYLSNLRQGNACTKTRGDVNGSGKKPFRQKGTGSARQGERRSPLARGGGVVFGPKPRSFYMHVNRQEKRLALQRALYDTAVSGGLVVIEGLKEQKAPKTAEMAQVFDKLASEQKCLVVDRKFSRNQLLSLRNLSRVFCIDLPSVNALDIVRYPHVVMTEKALNEYIQGSK